MGGAHSDVHGMPAGHEVSAALRPEWASAATTSYAVICAPVNRQVHILPSVSSAVSEAAWHLFPTVRRTAWTIRGDEPRLLGDSHCRVLVNEVMALPGA